jgi:hypothetical protein
MKVWAFIGPDGTIMADTEFKTEADAWWSELRCRSPEDIEEYRRRGYRVERVEVGFARGRNFRVEGTLDD